MRILVGSRAAHHWFPSMRPGVDVDYLATEPWDVFRLAGFDIHHEPEWTTHRDLLESHASVLTSEGYVADPNFLYTLKVSHSFWDVKWQKTVSDIVFLKRAGCRLVPALYDVFYPTWERVHGAKKAYLNLPNEHFFTSRVKRAVPHDELHELFKLGATPKYQQLKKDPSKAYISKALFFAQPYEEQLNTVREEMWVLAAERQLTPGLTAIPKQACARALRLLITSASKGWFPLFVVDNYETLLSTPIPPQLRRFTHNEIR